ncbi:MAG: S9 family peptidase [Candidatus Krumholzibacteria bacterium]|nr:S9 family peptidase [Candidatus Krumholzibacteria bacterium]
MTLRIRLLAALCAALVFSFAVSTAPSSAPAAAPPADTAKAAAGVPVGEWLVLGPVGIPLPAFREESKKRYDAAYLLEFPHLDPAGLSPVAGARLAVPGFGHAVWNRVEADLTGAALGAAAGSPQAAWLAAWAELPRWMKISLSAESSDPFEIFIDGASVAKSTGGGAKEGTASLGQGKHLILVKTVSLPSDTIRDWRFGARISPGEGFDSQPELSLDPAAPMTLAQVLETPFVHGVDVSPDGSLAALSLHRTLPPEGTRENWVEIRRLPAGELVREIRDAELSSLQWAPVGRRISYVAGGRLRIIDIDTGAVETLLEDLKDLGGYEWSPAGDFVLYSVTEKPDEDKTGVKRLLGIYDRPPYGRNLSVVRIAAVPGGAVRQATAGRYGVNVHDIDPGGRLAIIERSREDLSARPFSVQQILLLDIADQSTELLVEGRWLGRASWSPDGSKILISAGPSSFGDRGKDVPEGAIPNDYDTQLYIIDPRTKEIEAITADFDPAVSRAFWAPFDGKIYLTAEQSEFVRLYRYDPESKRFAAIDAGVEVIGSIDFARDRPVAVYTGSGADAPHRVWSLELSGRKKPRMIRDPGEEMFRHVVLGRVEPWDFAAPDGETIVGRVHYPPGFDPAKRYPCIVNYYAGTSPVDRTFGGRYPKNLWAAHGYVVYVLQPSGATGFGQEWSARHVNEWGRITADEIVESTRAFLAAHPFVDPARVGCIGASFGGFMTQLLLTRTDIFAAAVSHAGISMIPSYWGEGNWGYAYNAVSAAESYPWNSPEIYIGQSPLFAADRIRTPLLLTHGTADDNVPPGESEQMYTALKILGREVEYLRFSGQGHFILDFGQRRIWNDAIVSWFDRWLKDQPEWWNDSYPPEGEAKAGGTGAADEAGDPAPAKPAPIELRAVEIPGRGTVLFGPVTRESIAERLGDWDREFFEYEPDPAVVAALEEKLFGAAFTVVLGTWCSDSQREVPRLWKVLEAAGYPVDEIEMIAVGSSRFTVEAGVPAELIEWSDAAKRYHRVEAVETIIVSRGGTELGRIVEAPEGTLEEALLRILE